MSTAVVLPLCLSQHGAARWEDKDRSFCLRCRRPSPGTETEGHSLMCLSSDAVQLPFPATHLSAFEEEQQGPGWSR